MSQFFVLLSKAARQLLFYILAKLSTQVQVYGTNANYGMGERLNESAKKWFYISANICTLDVRKPDLSGYETSSFRMQN